MSYRITITEHSEIIPGQVSTRNTFYEQEVDHLNVASVVAAVNNYPLDEPYTQCPTPDAEVVQEAPTESLEVVLRYAAFGDDSGLLKDWMYRIEVMEGRILMRLLDPDNVIMGTVLATDPNHKIDMGKVAASAIDNSHKLAADQKPKGD